MDKQPQPHGAYLTEPENHLKGMWLLYLRHTIAFHQNETPFRQKCAKYATSTSVILPT